MPNWYPILLQFTQDPASKLRHTSLHRAINKNTLVVASADLSVDWSCTRFSANVFHYHFADIFGTVNAVLFFHYTSINCCYRHKTYHFLSIRKMDRKSIQTFIRQQVWKRWLLIQTFLWHLSGRVLNNHFNVKCQLMKYYFRWHIWGFKHKSVFI